jgi:hypothetical protein
MISQIWRWQIGFPEKLDVTVKEVKWSVPFHISEYPFRPIQSVDILRFSKGNWGVYDWKDCTIDVEKFFELFGVWPLSGVLDYSHYSFVYGVHPEKYLNFGMMSFAEIVSVGYKNLCKRIHQFEEVMADAKRAFWSRDK